jgi:bidirectional [NiFe] hydrogenase diaphorase subunit
MGTACYIKGAPQLLSALQHDLDIKPGETTPDNKVSLLTARCLGSCGLAPAVVYDNEVAGKVGTSDLRQRLAKWTANVS